MNHVTLNQLRVILCKPVFPACETLVTSFFICPTEATTTSQLKISRLNQYRGPCTGKTEIYMLCDKVQKGKLDRTGLTETKQLTCRVWGCFFHSLKRFTFNHGFSGSMMFSRSTCSKEDYVNINSDAIEDYIHWSEWLSMLSLIHRWHRDHLQERFLEGKRGVCPDRRAPADQHRV